MSCLKENNTIQYETIILELMSRIQKLEEEVTLLKQRLDEGADTKADDSVMQESNTAYKKMTDEMIELCYKYGKKVHQGENIQEIADDIVYETGMNRNSAIMYLQVVDSMLSGTIYKRAINSKALQKYYENIWNEYGTAGLKKATTATKYHIEYRRELGHPVDSIEEICNKWERRL